MSISLFVHSNFPEADTLCGHSTNPSFFTFLFQTELYGEKSITDRLEQHYDFDLALLQNIVYTDDEAVIKDYLQPTKDLLALARNVRNCIAKDLFIRQKIAYRFGVLSGEEC